MVGSLFLKFHRFHQNKFSNFASEGVTNRVIPYYAIFHNSKRVGDEARVLDTLGTLNLSKLLLIVSLRPRFNESNGLACQDRPNEPLSLSLEAITFTSFSPAKILTKIRTFGQNPDFDQNSKFQKITISSKTVDMIGQK